MKSRISTWKGDPVAFIREVLINPETNEAFELYEEERRFLCEALTLTPEGRMPFTELCFSAGKKSGKTAFAAMIAIYTAVVLAGVGGEIYCLANDLEQSISRVFRAIGQIIAASPLLRNSAVITANKITFRSTGTFIQAVANDYEGFSGANPTLNLYDELAYFSSESSRRLWDEGVPSPARRISFRLSVSTAGFEDEPSPLRDIYDRAMKCGQLIAPDLRSDENLLCYWTHELKAPWQSEAWKAEMQRTLRPNQYLRLIENKWATTESSFIDMAWWAACVDPALTPVVKDPRLSVHVGLDASYKRDSTAIVVCAFDEELKKVRLVWHRIFQPSVKDPLNFEETIERTLLELRDRFEIRQVKYDPYQLVAVAQRLVKAGLPMVEFSQNIPNLTAASNNLYELIKGRNLVVYPDDAARLSVSHAVAVETPRGWKISKEKASHKVDFVVALAQAALGAVEEQECEPGIIDWYRRELGLVPPTEDGPIDTAEETNELIEEYERVVHESEEPYCQNPKCGKLIRRGQSQTNGSDGRLYHADCYKPF